jgi:hypothetical protein
MVWLSSETGWPIQMQLPPDTVDQPLPDQGLVGDRLHRSDLAKCLDLRRIKLDREVLKAPRPPSPQDLLSQLLIQGKA